MRNTSVREPHATRNATAIAASVFTRNARDPRAEQRGPWRFRVKTMYQSTTAIVAINPSDSDAAGSRIAPRQATAPQGSLSPPMER
uniref:Uncharacterized protein n=1 Tax=Paraburkholderia sprentiae WSM5005 TaxID=754502 RepID=A0A1I9YQI1_9BURK